MQRIKAVMFVIVSINLITVINTSYTFITLLAVAAILLSSYNIYLIGKVDNDA